MICVSKVNNNISNDNIAFTLLYFKATSLAKLKVFIELILSFIEVYDVEIGLRWSFIKVDNGLRFWCLGIDVAHPWFF